MSKGTRPCSSVVAGATAAILWIGGAAPASALASPGEAPVGEDPLEGSRAEGSAEGPTQAPAKKWVWGRYDAPRWKYAAVGTAAGLTLVALGVGIGTLLQVRPNGKLKKQLIQAADDSLVDDKPANDVSPFVADDLCARARAMPEGGATGTVTNAEMTKICNKADTLARVSLGGFIASGVLLAATAAFTVLLFVHRRDPKVARLMRRGLTFGVAPTRGGWTVGAGLRF